MKYLNFKKYCHEEGGDPEPGNLLLTYHTWLHEHNRKGRSRLEHCANTRDVMLSGRDAFARLLQMFPGHGQEVDDYLRMARVAVICATVRTHRPAPGHARSFGYDLAQGKTGPPVSKDRVNTLLEIQDPDMALAQVKSMLRIIGYTCDLPALAHAIYHWGDKGVRRDIARHYYTRIPYSDLK